MSKKQAFVYIICSYIVALLVGLISYHLIKTHFSVLIATLIADIISTIIIFISSRMINNSSVYDPYWSVMPLFIMLLWAIEFEVTINLSIILAFLAVIIWAYRLTKNWAINWQGINHEDWRYVGFREKFKQFYWPISFLAIHLFPTIMVFMGLLPMYYLMKENGNHVILSVIGFIIALIAVYISDKADKDLFLHRNSEKAKYSISSGVWKYSRHPNYLGELLFWLGCLISGFYFEFYFASIGFIAMLKLFHGYSIPAMEKRLLKSRPDYSYIQKTIPRLLPKIKLIKRKKK